MLFAYHGGPQVSQNISQQFIGKLIDDSRQDMTLV
jgi:hypothetical protein